MEDHQQHHSTAGTFTRAASPYDRLATAVADRNAVIERNARELGDAQKRVDAAMTDVAKATKAPTAGRRGSRGRSS